MTYINPTLHKFLLPGAKLKKTVEMYFVSHIKLDSKGCLTILYYIILYYITSCHIIYYITSYHIISYIISHHIISYHIILYIISYHIISYHNISYYIILYYITLHYIAFCFVLALVLTFLLHISKHTFEIFPAHEIKNLNWIYRNSYLHKIWLA